jgi:hypothetical protein
MKTSIDENFMRSANAPVNERRRDDREGQLEAEVDRFGNRRREVAHGQRGRLVGLDVVHARQEHAREAADKRVARREREAVADHGPDHRHETGDREALHDGREHVLLADPASSEQRADISRDIKSLRNSGFLLSLFFYRASPRVSPVRIRITCAAKVLEKHVKHPSQTCRLPNNRKQNNREHCPADQTVGDPATSVVAYGDAHQGWTLSLEQSDGRRSRRVREHPQICNPSLEKMHPCLI